MIERLAIPFDTVQLCHFKALWCDTTFSEVRRKKSRQVDRGFPQVSNAADSSVPSTEAGSDLSIFSYLLGLLNCDGVFQCSGHRIPLGLDFALTFLVAWVSIWHTTRITSAHFTSALVELSKRSGFSDDVSGATLLAAATSLPVLFASIISTFVFISNDGVAVVVGTCVYNLLVCVALTSFVYGCRLSPVTKRSFARDMLFYIASLVILFVFLLDEEVELYEAALLNVVYVVYCLTTTLLHKFHQSRLQKKVKDEESGEIRRDASSTSTIATTTENPVNIGSSKRYRDPIGWLFDRFLFPRNPERYCLIGSLSIVYLFVLTYLMVDSVSRLSVIVQLNPAVVTLIILPIGTNLPSTVGGYVSAKLESSADMAVCSSFGSNIFSILVGMGLPWLLRIATGSKVTLPGVSSALPAFSILVSVHIFLFCVIVGLISRFALTRLTGILLSFTYLAYVAVVISGAIQPS